MKDHERRVPRGRHQLRQQAIERLHAQGGNPSDMPANEIDSLVHELEVYQVELEIQNEELRRTEQALARAVERYRDLYDRAPVAYLSLTPDGKILQANRAAVQLCARDHDELEGRPLLRLVVPDDQARLNLTLRSASSTGVPQATEFQILRGRATPRWVHAEISWAANDGQSGYRVMLLDVTSRVQTNAALQQQREAAVRNMEEAVEARARAESATAELRLSEERFRLASSAGATLVYEIELGEPHRVYIHGMERVTGHKKDGEGHAREWWDSLIHPNDLPGHHDTLARRQKKGGSYFSVYRMQRKDGAWITVEDTGQVICGRKGVALKLVGAITDVTERLKAEQGLREANDRKDEFLATLAHELRNPLAPIRNALQVLRIQEPSPARMQWARDLIDRQIERMTRLVDDLLDLSRITRGKVELRKQRITLRSVMEDAIETTRPLIERGGHSFKVEFPSEPIVLDGDTTRLSQAFVNLLNNAIKYSPGGSAILFSAEREGEHAVIRVKDAGIGIDPASLSRIFEMFVQGDSSIEQRQGGIGIGLTLVRRLVEMHGGSVEAHSEGAGKGSEFVIRLPVAAPATESDLRDSGRLNELDLAAPSRRILVVDDNRDSAETMAMLLRLSGHDVRTAHDGLSALEVAAAFAPELVLLDIGLPGLNGYDVAIQMRAGYGTDVTIIAMTGWGQEEDRRRAKEAGFDHHLTKPVDFNALNQILTQTN